MKDRIKILFIIGSFGVGGKERQLAELIKGLPKDMYSVSCILKNGNAHYLQTIESNVDYLFSLEVKRFGFRSFFKICRKILILKPDIVHSWASAATVQVIPAKIVLKFKLIDGSIRDSTKPRLLDMILKKIITLYSDKIIANSKAGLICYKIPYRKSNFIHNGFDFERIIGIESVEYVKSKFNILSVNLIGMVGRIDFEKDYPTFIKAAKIILLDRNDVKFVIVGDGKDKEKIESMIAFGDKEKFLFTGQQPDVESIINCFDIAVLATFKEGISNSIIEYMALEKPVIATDGGGTSELVKDEVTGYLVKEGDEYQLADKIKVLLDQPDLRSRMGIEGKKRIIKDFSFEKMIYRFQGEYEKILKN